VIIFLFIFVIIYQNNMHGREALSRSVFHLIRAYKKSTHRAVACSVPILYSSNTLRFALSSFPNTNLHPPSKGLASISRPWRIPTKLPSRFSKETISPSLWPNTLPISPINSLRKGGLSPFACLVALCSSISGGLLFVWKCSNFELKGVSIELNWIELMWMCFVLGSQETAGTALSWFSGMVQMACVLAGWEGRA